MLLIVAIQSFFVLGIGLLLSRAQRLLPRRAAPLAIVLMALFYSAPIVYPITVVPKHAHMLGVDIPLLRIYKLNPLVRFVRGVPRRAVRPAVPAAVSTSRT